MNILVLPLYMCADRMQEMAKQKEASLHDGIVHIKKTFSGDERMMILQTYYKQNKYSPISALNGSVSLLLQIPFFMAAYQFLSNLSILDGASLGPISNLANPDALIKIGMVTINLLPILMTIINIISSVLFLKGATIKSKIQLYAMAIFFLVFLYTSPSGLVFYWTLNNVFSLGKTIFYKLKNPKKALLIFNSSTGLLLIILSFIIKQSYTTALLVIGILLELPLTIFLIKTKLVPIITRLIKEKLSPVLSKKQDGVSKNSKRENINSTYNRKHFIISCALITLFIGVFIPSTYIAASPQEFIHTNLFNNPLKYILSSFFIAFGFFMVWLQVFYWLASDKAKVIYDKSISILAIVMIVNYMFFGLKLGNITSSLKYDTGLIFSVLEIVINILVFIILIVSFIFIMKKWEKIVAMSLISILVITTAMSGINIIKSAKSINDYSNYNDSSSTNENLKYNLSKTGKNVIVIMLDRAIGQFVPYIMNERPELVEKFDGFTYYSNTISFGAFTNFASPALLGGYEYTPVELNKRDDELLKDKNNEANLVLPRIFSEQGYDVTVSDPVYLNYQWFSDLSIFDDYANINAISTIGKFIDEQQISYAYESNMENFFKFSFMKSMPLLLQTLLYENGNYNNLNSKNEIGRYNNQVVFNMSKSSGIFRPFMDNYLSLKNMNTMTNITDEKTNTYLFFRNDLTHEPMLLDEANGYIPNFSVDNTEFDKNNADRFNLGSSSIKINNSNAMSHYQTNLAALLQLGNYFDYLRQNGVYDNSRIIIASDHGRELDAIDELQLKGTDLSYYCPLLMVKDFGESGFKTSTEFMTNADVATLATQNLEFEAKNPFTGKIISSDEKYTHKQYIISSIEWDVYKNNGETFKASKWISFDSTQPNCNIYNHDNWDFLNKKSVLKKHSFNN